MPDIERPTIIDQGSEEPGGSSQLENHVCQRGPTRRFSIRALMALVLVSAVGLAALRNANDLWAGMMLMVALAAVGISVMGAVILRGQERYWWAGFAFFGGGYLALALGPGLSDTLQPQLGTTLVLRGVHSRIAQGTSQIEGEMLSLELHAQREKWAEYLKRTDACVERRQLSSCGGRERRDCEAGREARCNQDCHAAL